MASTPRRLIVGFLILFLAGGTAWYEVTHQEKTRTDALVLFGNIDLREVQLAFHDTGRIQKLLFVEGAPVKAGALMAVMDPVRYQDRVEADLRTLERDRAQRLNAQRTWTRVKRLTRASFNSRQQKDDARAALDMAKAQVKKDKAQLAYDTRQLDDTKVYAPVDGIVQNRILEPGDMAFPQTPVYTLARTRPLWARVYVEEPELGKVHQGMVATVTSDSFPGERFLGYVGYISPSAEFTPKDVQTLHQRTILVYRARVYLSCPTRNLRLGMPVTVTIPFHGGPILPHTCPDGSPAETVSDGG
ncbi:MAG: efflux RND transporter periplasmic adaptor subunit [Nitrospirae bacterium]|jgi:HlyD family secretion protein|nr:efflux RND transporter periplasmic adaptor subunit [Nitrospirota bacterium]